MYDGLQESQQQHLGLEFNGFDLGGSGQSSRQPRQEADSRRKRGAAETQPEPAHKSKQKRQERQAEEKEEDLTVVTLPGKEALNALSASQVLGFVQELEALEDEEVR